MKESTVLITVAINPVKNNPNRIGGRRDPAIVRYDVVASADIRPALFAAAA